MLFKYSFPHFPPTTPPTPAIPNSHPWSYPHLVLSMCPLYMFLKTFKKCTKNEYIFFYAIFSLLGSVSHFLQLLFLIGGINGDGQRLDLGWWTHNTVYRSCVVGLCTWNLYNFANQCHPTKFNKEEKITKTNLFTLLIFLW